MRFANNAGAFHIEPLPSQPQLAHCHGFYVNHDMRRQGHGRLLKEQQMQHLEKRVSGNSGGFSLMRRTKLSGEHDE